MTDHAAPQPSDSPAAPAPAVSTADLPERAYRSRGAWLRFLIPAVLGLAADLALKAWSFPEGVPTSKIIGAGRVPAGFAEPQAIIPGVLRFTTTINYGAVFGFGQGYVLVFLAFSLVALGIILWVFLTSLKTHRAVHLALGLITAGALGNLWDRAIHGGVRDMLQFTANWYPYIFNVADVLLCVGVPLLMVRWLFWNDNPIVPAPHTGKLSAPQPQNPST